MTSRERVRAALNHEQPDRVPVDFGSTMVSGISVSVISHCGGTDHATVTSATDAPEPTFATTTSFRIISDDSGRALMPTASGATASTGAGTVVRLKGAFDASTLPDQRASCSLRQRCSSLLTSYFNTP